MLVNDIQHCWNICGYATTDLHDLSDHQKECVLSDDETKKEITWSSVAEALDVSVKDDKATKLVLLADMLLAQTEDSMFNIGLHSISSSGKSYIALQVAELFPQDDLVILGDASPRAFFHDHDQYDEATHTYIKNLEGKIVILLDVPSYQLLKTLRPILSHDKKEIEFKITDKTKRQQNRTKTIKVVGYAAFIQCSVSSVPDEQERTRLLLLSAETSQEKLKKSLELMALRECNREKYEELVNRDPKRLELKRRIQRIRLEKVKDIIIPDESKVLEKFSEKHPDLKPRHQRDFPRMIDLIKAHALLNCMNRTRVEEREDVIMANETDVSKGMELYDSVANSNELGLSPYLYQVYTEVFLPLFDEAEKQEITHIKRVDLMKKYYSVFHTTLDTRSLNNNITSQLVQSGLIEEDTDPDDKRKVIYQKPVNLPSKHETKICVYGSGKRF